MRTIPRAGGAVTVLPSGAPAYALALDGTFVHITSSCDGRLYQLPQAGGGISQTYATERVFPTDPRAVNEKVIFTVDDNGGPHATARSVSTGGGTVTTLANGLNCAACMTADNTTAYVIAKNSGEMVAVPFQEGVGKLGTPFWRIHAVAVKAICRPS